MSQFINDLERTKIIKDIREFLKNPAHSGGIFVVSGLRGTGKTRVVDEALTNNCNDLNINIIKFLVSLLKTIFEFFIITVLYLLHFLYLFFTNIKDWKFRTVDHLKTGNIRIIHYIKKISSFISTLFCYIFGVFRILDSRNIKRRTLSILRFPRKIERHIIKIDIRFPLTRNVDNITQYIKGSLLDSIIFELTSQVDPRSSRRLYAKTLRQRLGFWRYWFSFNGLVTPDIFIFFKLFIIFCIFGLSTIWYILIIYFFNFQSIPSFSIFFDIFYNFLYLTLIINLCILLVSWWILRFLDWQGFNRFNIRLYGITHAEKAEEYIDSLSSDMKNNNFKRNFIKLIGIISFIVPIIGIYLRYHPPTSTTQILSSNTNGLMGFFYYIINNISVYFNNVFIDFNNINIIICFIIGIFSILYLQRFSLKGLETIFNGDSSEWKITLLRRYLFLLHQLGIEPVLVLDELDKLEKDFPIRIKQECDLGLLQLLKNQNNTDELTNYKYDKVKLHGLDLLFNELIPLKQNIGTHFLWILIGGTGLMARTIKSNHEFPPNRESTIIQKHTSLGVIHREQTRKYLEKNYRIIFEKKSNKEIQTIADFFWITSRGLYSQLYAQEKNIEHIINNLNKNVKGIADICEICIRPESIEGVLSNLNTNDIILTPEAQCLFNNWLLMGILDRARSELLGYKEWEINKNDFSNNENNIISLINNPEQIMTKGRNLFTLYMNNS